MLADKAWRVCAFQFIPKVLGGAEVRTQCRQIKFFHTKLGKQFLYEAGFVSCGTVSIIKKNTVVSWYSGFKFPFTGKQGGADPG